MIQSMIVDYLRNGLNMAKIQLQGVSVLSQAKVYVMMMRAEDIGDQCLFMHMMLNETFILELGMMIKMVIAILLVLTYYLMLKTQEYSLKELHKLIKREFSLTHKSDTISSLTTCQLVQNYQN